MVKTIRIEDWKEAAQAEVTLSGGRQLKLRRPNFRVRNQAVWAARRPGWGSAKAAANAILLRSGDGELSSSELAELSDHDRHRLVIAVVRLVGVKKDWRRLYGTSLVLDERFLATMIWAERREARELQNGLRAMRERLRERPQAQAQAMARSIAGVTGIAKQVAAMNSLVHTAKRVGLGPRFEPSIIAGKANGLDATKGFAANLGMARVAEVMKTTMLDRGVLGTARMDLTATGLHERWGSGLAGAALRAEMPGIAAQMRALSIGKDLGAARFAGDLSARVPSLVSQLDPTVGPAGAGVFKPSISSALLGGGLSGSLAKLDPTKLGFGSEIWRQMQRTTESLLMAEMARLWGGDPLWFLISYLNPRKLPALLDLGREEVYEAVLDGLEEVVRDPALTEQLLAACEEIGFLGPEQREWLRHGLKHACDGEWLQAMPPLTWGFEGAIFNGAVAAKAIAAREGKKLGAEKVIKAIQLDEELEVFAIRLVFGGRGNAFRHGRPENQARDQALLQIVALVGWVDFTLGSSGTARLAHRLESPLAGELGTVRQRELASA